VTVAPAASLVIGIASSAADRAQLARLLGGTDAYLLVSSAEQARAFLAPAAPVVPAPPEPEPARPDLTLDPDRRVLCWQDREIELTRLEHDFLHCLASERGQVWTYQRLHRVVWGNDHLGRGSDIHSVVRRVRRKLARLEATVTIHVVRGVGLRLPPL
jgi:DNA-binding response OmpR family regulator